MPSTVSALYDLLIEREIERIPEGVRAFRENHGSDELFIAIGRFAILAYAPSQHLKHALLAVLAAHDLREAAGTTWDELLIECARYIAASRQPWSEPPMLEPPNHDPSQLTDVVELRRAVKAGDRVTGERWLAARLHDPALARDLFAVACDDFEDLGHKLIVCVAAWRLAEMLGEKGRYAALRVAIWEMTAYSGEQFIGGSQSVPRQGLVDRLIANCAADRGSIESAHAVFLFDAGLEASRITGDDLMIDRVSAYLQTLPARDVAAAIASKESSAVVPIYELGRDYAECLKAAAVGLRLRATFPGARIGDFLAAAQYNLENAPSFADWSLA